MLNKYTCAVKTLITEFSTVNSGEKLDDKTQVYPSCADRPTRLQRNDYTSRRLAAGCESRRSIKIDVRLQILSQPSHHQRRHADGRQAFGGADGLQQRGSDRIGQSSGTDVY